MRLFLALVLSASCVTARADPVFVLNADEMHYPVRAEDIAAVQRDGDVLAKAAGLASLRPAGDFELRLWTQSVVWTRYRGEGTAYVIAKGRLTTYALSRPGDRLRALRVSSRRLSPGKVPVAELRAVWKVAGRPGCGVADAITFSVEASLDGATIAFSGQDVGDICKDEVDARMTTLVRAVSELAGR